MKEIQEITGYKWLAALGSEVWELLSISKTNEKFHSIVTRWNKLERDIWRNKNTYRLFIQFV